jgi:hypothetical protein
MLWNAAKIYPGRKRIQGKSEYEKEEEKQIKTRDCTKHDIILFA